MTLAAGPLQATGLVALFALVLTLQTARERVDARTPPPGAPQILYVRSPAAAARLALSYSSIAADVYWMRAVQHYGRTRLDREGTGRYELLFPLLDLATTLDPFFNVAYRFGAIFLTEPPPGGPGRPDLAVALLRKGLEAQPHRWEFAQDIGFVYYRTGDYDTAAEWFGRAAGMDDAPNWLRPLEAVTRTQGGRRESSRQLWTEIAAQAGPEEDWLRDQASFRLRQLDALDQIDALEAVTRRFEERTGNPPRAWMDLVRTGELAGIPVDPAGVAYQLNPWWGLVSLDPASPLNPLPAADPAAP